MKFRFPEKYRPSTVTKACKSRGHRWTNTVQIFNLCTCWRLEIWSHSCWSKFRCCHHPPILPKLRPSTFQATLAPSGTKRGLSSDGSFKTLANTRNQADFALRTLPTIKHIDLKNDRNCPKMIWNVIETSQIVTNAYDMLLWKLAWFFTAAALSCLQPLRSSTPAENSEKPGVSALGYNNTSGSSCACAAGRTNTTLMTQYHLRMWPKGWSCVRVRQDRLGKPQSLARVASLPCASLSRGERVNGRYKVAGSNFSCKLAS